MSDETTDRDRFSDDIGRRWVKRARGIMTNHYSTNHLVNIAGLYLQRVDTDGSIYDVFVASDDEEYGYEYVDTLRVDRFRSAGQLVETLHRSYENLVSETDDEPPADREEPDPDPTPSFQ